MILEFPQVFAPDAVERQLPDVAAARTLLDGRAPLLEQALERRHQDLSALATDDDGPLLQHTFDAVRLAYARLGLRHGSFGTDRHAYHNEGHILDIIDGRIGQLIATIGVPALALTDWCVLLLFGACHDLRQRETALFVAGVGANERASIDESLRLLDTCGFCRVRDEGIYLALELAIAGSTFDARPARGGLAYNAAELVQVSGALAANLATKLDKHRPDWRHNPHLLHAHGLALIAADLDTANVAEPFPHLARSAVDLCREREMLCGRSLHTAASALPVLSFLTDGQRQFFFELHRFSSDAGIAAFGPGKDANASRLKTLSLALRARIALGGVPTSGQQVLDAYCALAQPSR